MDTGSVHENKGIRGDASTGRFDRRLNDLSSWPAARKSLLVSGVVLFLCLYAMILLQFARLNPEVVPFISRTGLEHQIEISFLTIAAWVLLGAASLLLPRRFSDSRFFEHAPVQIFAISNATFGYFYGFFTDPYAFVTLIGGIMVGLPLFGRTATRAGFMSWFVMFGMLTVLEQADVIPYAPLLAGSPITDGSLSTYWALGMGSINVIGGLLSASFGFFLLGRIQKSDRLLQENQRKLLKVVAELRETTSALEDSGRELELRVDERTLELKVANRNLLFEIDAREKSAAELARVRAAMEAAIEGVARVGADGRIQNANKAFLAMHGADAGDMVGSAANQWIDAGNHREVERLVLDIADVEKVECNVTGTRSDRSTFPQQIAMVGISGGEPGEHFRFARDVTRQTELSAQLNQAMKMEAIGHLAGGIAHDFNNLLMAILTASGHLQEFFQDSSEGSEELEMAEMITTAGTRAAALTTQLLDFAHVHPPSTANIDINECLKGMLDLLKTAVDDSIEIDLDLCGEPLATLGDSSRFDSGLLNVALNARDAMPEGGRLIIETKIVEIDHDDPAFVNFRPRMTRHARIDLIDTGSGMDAETMTKVFDPFFTTKPAGKGTGLGLSVFSVYVREVGGALKMTSAVGSGTTCSIYVPLVDLDSPVDESPRPASDAGRGETILLAEDEDMVARATDRMLTRGGYRVVRCVNGLEAVELFRERGGEFDLALLDYRMPIMTGAETLIELNKLDSDMPIILMSGNLSLAESKGLEKRGLKAILRKPCSKAELIGKIREVLDESSRGN